MIKVIQLVKENKGATIGMIVGVTYLSLNRHKYGMISMAEPLPLPFAIFYGGLVGGVIGSIIEKLLIKQSKSSKVQKTK